MATVAISLIDEAKPDFGMPVHEVCDFYPLMEQDSLAKLAFDIKANGLVHPLVVYGGELIDGRNRLLACRMAGVEPRFVEWKDIYAGPMSVGRWIRSSNTERRHMTDDQIAATEVALHGWEDRQAARERQLQQGECGKDGGRGHKKPSPSGDGKGFPAQAPPKPRSGVAATIAADSGVSERKVQRALNLQKENPQLLKDVMHGKKPLHEAEKQARSSPAAEWRKVRSERIDKLSRARVALLEDLKKCTHLVGWMGETHGDFDRAEALLRKVSECVAAVSAEIGQVALADDPRNASRLGIQTEKIA